MSPLFKKYKKQVPFKTELMEELRFVLKFSGNTKPVKYPKRSSSKSTASSKGDSTSSISVESLANDDQQLQKRKSIK